MVLTGGVHGELLGAVDVEYVEVAILINGNIGARAGQRASFIGERPSDGAKGRVSGNDRDWAGPGCSLIGAGKKLEVVV